MVEFTLPKNSRITTGKVWPKPEGAANLRTFRIYRWDPDSGDKPRIEIENRSSVTRLVLSQPVDLLPGTYALRAKVDGPGGQHLAASLNCTTPSRPRVRRARLDREGQQLVAPQCSDAVLSLWLRPGSGRVVVDRVELEPVTP